MAKGAQQRNALSALAIACLIAISPYGLQAQETRNIEYELKAAFLLNFTRFVDWPASAFAGPDAPLEICVLGKDPFGRILDDVIKGETVNGRRLVARRINRAPAPSTCQELFIDPDFKDLAGVIKEVDRGILTVSEGDRFLREGGAISFVIENRRVRFDINQAVADAAGLRLSSKLLSVARMVIRYLGCRSHQARYRSRDRGA